MRLLEFLSNRGNKTSRQEELLYEYVAIELEEGALSRGLWTKALSQTDFDENRARALYVKMRIASLQAELKDIAPDIKQLEETKTGLQNLLEQGCSQEAIDYLGNPILVDAYRRKYRVSVKKINYAIKVGKIKGCLVNGALWVQDRSL